MARERAVARQSKQQKELVGRGKRTNVRVYASKTLPGGVIADDIDTLFEAASSPGKENSANEATPPVDEKAQEDRKKTIRFTLGEESIRTTNSSGTSDSVHDKGSIKRKLKRTASHTSVSPSELSSVATAPSSEKARSRGQHRLDGYDKRLSSTSQGEEIEQTRGSRQDVDVYETPMAIKASVKEEGVMDNDDDLEVEPIDDLDDGPPPADDDDDEDMIPPPPADSPLAPMDDDDNLDVEEAHSNTQENIVPGGLDDDNDKEGDGFQMGSETDPMAEPETEVEQEKRKRRRKRANLKGRKKRSVPFSPKGIQSGPRTFHDVPVRDPVSPTDGAPRRSKRTAQKPLRFWLNERPEYVPNDFPEEMAEGGLTCMPMVKNYKISDPTPYKQRAVTVSVEKKSKGGKDKKSQVLEASSEVVPFDTSRLRKKYKILDSDVAHVWDDCREKPAELSKSTTLSLDSQCRY